jgi:hypothetical protein
MPTFEEPLYDYLTTVLAAEVGSRVYPKRGAEGTILPYITYERVSAQRTYTYDAFAETTAWINARVSFACIALTMAEAIVVAEALIVALSGYEGDLDGIPIGSANVIGEIDLYDENSRLYRRVVDVSFAYEEVGVSS